MITRHKQMLLYLLTYQLSKQKSDRQMAMRFQLPFKTFANQNTPKWPISLQIRWNSFLRSNRSKTGLIEVTEMMQEQLDQLHRMLPISEYQKLKDLMKQIDQLLDPNDKKS